MKYVLYRFPNAVRYSDTSDPELYGFFKFPVQGQIVGVEFGSSIEDVTDELVQDVNDELAGAYLRRRRTGTADQSGRSPEMVQTGRRKESRRRTGERGARRKSAAIK